MTKTAKLRRHGIMIEYSRDYYCYSDIDSDEMRAELQRFVLILQK